MLLDMNLKFEVVIKDQVAKATNPGPLLVLVIVLQMSFKFVKFAVSVGALETRIHLVLKGHVIYSLGMLIEDLVTKTALNLGSLTSMLGFYVGIQARLGKLLVTRNAEVGIFGLFLALVDFDVGQLSRISSSSRGRRSLRRWSRSRSRGRSYCCFFCSRGFRIDAAASSYDDGRAILVFVNPCWPF